MVHGGGGPPWDPKNNFAIVICDEYYTLYIYTLTIFKKQIPPQKKYRFKMVANDLFTLPAPAGQGLILHRVLLLLLLSSSSSSSFCQHVNISCMLRSILTKLGLNDQYLNRYSHTYNGGVKGHDGVTGVKKVIFTKIAIFRTDYMLWSCDSYMFIS